MSDNKKHVQQAHQVCCINVTRLDAVSRRGFSFLRYPAMVQLSGLIQRAAGSAAREVSQTPKPLLGVERV